MIRPYYQVALVNIWDFQLLLIILHSRYLAEVLLFVTGITNDLAHVCIDVVE